MNDSGYCGLSGFIPTNGPNRFAIAGERFALATAARAVTASNNVSFHTSPGSCEDEYQPVSSTLTIRRWAWINLGMVLSLAWTGSHLAFPMCNVGIALG
jgi:hypothetical protein